MPKDKVILEVTNLKKYYPISAGLLAGGKKGAVKAVDDVSLNVYEGETLGIVGESGCGKTTFGKCLVRLHKLTGGHMNINIDDEMVDLTALNKKDSFRTRRRVQMVFQDPFSSFNPVKTIINTFDEPLRIHGFGDKNQRKEIIAEALKTVNLQADYMYRYPHEFSGGQRQRICIARALSLDPQVIVCDEPVSALDVSIQAQILNLMKDLQVERNLTYVFIAHDLSVVQYMSDRIAVMYLGKVVELADAEGLYNNSTHPYTEALLSAVPVPIIGAKRDRIILTGDVPSPINPPSGCPFHPRCPKAIDICSVEAPEFRGLNGDEDHLVACHLADNKK